VETVTFDVDYFFDWYAPRELRYYFHDLLPTVAEMIRYYAGPCASLDTFVKTMTQRISRQKFVQNIPQEKP
jgi:hypothetical protein